MLETAAFIGLFVPSGPTILFAAFLANTRYFQLEHVILATLLGGFSGDQIGYWLGRLYGTRGLTEHGRIGRLWRRHEVRAMALFRRRSVLAVSFARCIAFVRTVMPWFAGMSRMPYGRFVAYDGGGVLVWGGAHIVLGYTAGRSWQALASLMGSATLTLLVVAALGAGYIALRRRRTPLELISEDPHVPGLFRVGLTGNIASGKSVVTDVWHALGAPIIDADALSRAATEPGSEGLQRVVERFGSAVLSEDGTLDRAALRAAVFADEDERHALEVILHPEIERLRVEREHALHDAGAGIVVDAIPLLYEVGMEDAFDLVVLVDAPAGERLRRLVEQRGLPEEEARRMIEAQMASEQKRARADIVIENDGTLDELKEHARTTWQEIQRRASASA
jgi:dephospho-CoA kinase